MAPHAVSRRSRREGLERSSTAEPVTRPRRATPLPARSNPWPQQRASTRHQIPRLPALRTQARIMPALRPMLTRKPRRHLRGQPHNHPAIPIMTSREKPLRLQRRRRSTNRDLMGMRQQHATPRAIAAILAATRRPIMRPAPVHVPQQDLTATAIQPGPQQHERLQLPKTPAQQHTSQAIDATTFPSCPAPVRTGQRHEETTT